ncbi:hypothetical protein ACFL6E_05020, partial [Candidatus Neomarinimicrobiota bacterium]
MKILNMCLYNKFVTLMGITLMLVTCLSAGKPDILITGAFVTPRADLSADDNLIWRTQLIVAHQFSTRMSLSFSGEYAPKLLNRPEGFNLYSGALSYKVNQSLKVNVGRINRWDSMLPVRYDGLSATFKLAGGKQEVQLFGGFAPDSLSSNGFSQSGETVGGLAYYIRRGKNSYGAQVWSNTINDQQSSYVGSSIRQYFGPKLLQVVDLAYNIDQAIAEKIRLRTSYRASKVATIYLQYRSAGQFLYNAYPAHLYPSLTELTDLPNRQVVSVGGTYRVGRAAYVTCAVNQRLVYESRYISLRAGWKNLSIYTALSSLSSYTGQAVQVAYQQPLFKILTAGASVGFGSYSLIDDDAKAIASAGTGSISAAEMGSQNMSATFWLKSKGASPLQYRLFG